MRACLEGVAEGDIPVTFAPSFRRGDADAQVDGLTINRNAYTRRDVELARCENQKVVCRKAPHRTRLQTEVEK